MDHGTTLCYVYSGNQDGPTRSRLIHDFLIDYGAKFIRTRVLDKYFDYPIFDLGEQALMSYEFPLDVQGVSNKLYGISFRDQYKSKHSDGLVYRLNIHNCDLDPLILDFVDQNFAVTKKFYRLCKDFFLATKAQICYGSPIEQMMTYDEMKEDYSFAFSEMGPQILVEPFEDIGELKNIRGSIDNRKRIIVDETAQHCFGRCGVKF